MTEKLKANETVPKKAVIQSNSSKDFQKIVSKTKQIQEDEREQVLVDFLERNQIPDSENSRQKIKQLIMDGKTLDNTFSLEDLSEKEIIQIKEGNSKNKRNTLLNQDINQAQTAETLIDSWKDEGFSNYEVLQKLLTAHEIGEVTLLTEKYKQFKEFFDLLQSNNLGTKDTQKIIEIINRPEVDLSSPKTFEQMVFSIFEEDDISEATKAKIGEQFKLIPIVTGDDLRANLNTKQRQIVERETQRVEIEKTLVILEDQTKITKSRLAELKEEILIEKDPIKKQELEKKYDELEELLERLEKDQEDQKTLQIKLKQEIPNTVSVRGAEAKITGNEIVVTLPESSTKVAVPLELGSSAIGKTVNAYLVNQTMTEVGLENYFFSHSDFDSGNFPDPITLDRNNLFLVKLGFSYDGMILKKSEQKRLSKLLKRLMKHNFYSSHLNPKENANQRLQEIDLLQDRGLNHDKFTNKLIRLKQLGRIGL